MGDFLTLQVVNGSVDPTWLMGIFLTAISALYGNQIIECRRKDALINRLLDELHRTTDVLEKDVSLHERERGVRR